MKRVWCGRRRADKLPIEHRADCAAQCILQVRLANDSARQRVAGFVMDACMGCRRRAAMTVRAAGVCCLHPRRGAGAIVGDPASLPPLSEPRRRVISCWTGGASGHLAGAGCAARSYRSGSLTNRRIRKVCRSGRPQVPGLLANHSRPDSSCRRDSSRRNTGRGSSRRSTGRHNSHMSCSRSRHRLGTS
jgi:hypothetical protein